MLRFKTALAAALIFVIFAGATESMASSTITLQGQTKHPVLANAAVEVSAAGNQTVMGTTNQSGSYAIDFECTVPGGMVTITVTGTGEQSHVGAARVVHSCAHLSANADGQGVFAVGPISPISTAVYAIVAWTLSDFENLSPPWMRSALEPYRFAFEFWVGHSTVTSSLAFLNTQEIDLPAAASTSLDVALDRNLLAQSAQGVLDIAQAADYDRVLNPIYLDPSLYLPTPSVPATIVTANYCVSLLTSCGSVFVIDVNNFGSFSERGGSSASEFRFRDREDIIFQEKFVAAPGTLRAIRAATLDGSPLISRFLVQTIEGQQVEESSDLEWVEKLYANASEYLTLVGERNRTVRRFPNNPEIPEEVFESRRPFFLTGFEDTSELPSFVEPADGDQWVLEFDVSASIPELDLFFGPRADRVTFGADGTAVLERADTTMQWTVSDGELVLEGGGLPTHRYRLTSGEWAKAYSSMVVRAADSGEPTVSADVVGLSGAQSLVFDPADVPGRYWSIAFVGRLLPSGFPEPPSYFVQALEEGGTGWSASLADPADPKPDSARPLQWEVNARGEVVIERDFGASGTQLRNWTLLKIENGEDFSVLEVGPALFASPDFGGPEDPVLPLDTGRLNIYRQLPL
ncbi:carboxypeptidase-like regulatory domain-containing protein [Wenzhouxiangella limi]|uniref:Carboxypeptidase regulatory-like domain-containing protein n=1 Tax=Wenzhouxiangella limi TaxID=2707351 RepID=A0A845V282_9GAMM|nr:carboxypeptidase-like regulatory domain-containing protein [Wenzhouxiangella limi]NDY94391.1 carboxypeptidase regulatory-like domain-containing protein [Wenzhouxiangella limi]